MLQPNMLTNQHVNKPTCYKLTGQCGSATGVAQHEFGSFGSFGGFGPGFALLDLGPLTTRQEMVLQVFVVEGRLFQHQARLGALVDHRVVPPPKSFRTRHPLRVGVDVENVVVPFVGRGAGPNVHRAKTTFLESG